MSKIVFSRTGAPFIPVLLVASLSACTLFKPEPLPVGDQVDFTRHVKPILEGNCLQCHNRAKMPQRISFENRNLALREGRFGRAIIPGDPDNSRMLSFINAPRGTAEAMPRTGHVVSAEDAETLREWIAAGATWPDGPAGDLRPAAH